MTNDVESSVKAAEWALIEDGELLSEPENTIISVAKIVLEGEYISIFETDFAKQILRKGDPAAADIAKDADLRIFLQQGIESWRENESQSCETEFQLLAFGVACLHAFVQTNYTGPFLPFDSLNLLPASLRPHSEASKMILDCLSVDGERPYHLTPHPYFLLVASVILNHRIELSTAPWWRARVNFLHQRVLGDVSTKLHDEIISAMNEVRPAVESRSRDTKGRHTIEQALIRTYYGQETEALTMLQDAGNEIGLEWVLTGALGRRTKFQTFDVSQLVVLAQGRQRDGTTSQEPVKPTTLDLNDDTILEKISFTEKISPTSAVPESLASLDPSAPTPLHPLDSTVLLALTTCIKNTNPSDGLTMEEMKPYVDRVLSHSLNWTVHTMALILRSRLEHTNARTIQRSVFQLQALVDQLVDEIGPINRTSSSSNGITPPKSSFLPKPSDPSESAPTRVRLAYAWQLLLPSKWDLEAELAQRWVSLGALKSALEIFERLEMWDKVAICWAGTGRQDRAAEVLRTQLEKNPSDAKLWSLLGSVEQNPAYWEKAWEVSGARYAPAQRSLGTYYFERKEYKQARDAFKASLTINPLNHVAWFTYGCACLELEDFEEACEAFSRCVGLDSQDSESWSNLATALLKLGKKRDAWQALKQATSNNYENWKIWQNYMYVSVDVGEWSEAIRSLKRVVDVLGPKQGEGCIDEEVVEILVQRAVQDDPNKERGIGKQVLQLFNESLVPLITTSHRLWHCAATLYLWQNLYSEVLDVHVKAFRTYLNNPALERDEKVWDAAIEEAESLVDAYRNFGEKPDGKGGIVCRDWRYQSRSALRGLKGRGKLSFEGSHGWDKLEGLLESVKSS